MEEDLMFVVDEETTVSKYFYDRVVLVDPNTYDKLIMIGTPKEGYRFISNMEELCRSVESRLNSRSKC